MEGVVKISKPDLTNLLKFVEDALEGMFFKNDSQITGFGDTSKYYSEKPRTEIYITDE